MACQPWILGLNTSYHNGAACLCRGPEVIVAIQEERLNRTKRSRLLPGKPAEAIRYCLDVAGITVADLELVVDCGIAGSQLSVPDISVMVGAEPRQSIRISHHLGHAFSTFCTSGFSEAIVLVIDGAGSYGWELSADELRISSNCDPRWCEHLTLYHGTPAGMTPLAKFMSDTGYLHESFRTMPRFRTLGHMFSSVAHQVFGEYLEAGKVMGLAPLGCATIPPEQFVAFTGNEFRFRDDVPAAQQYTDRWPNHQEYYVNLAASVQIALERVLCDVLDAFRTAGECLCYSGGVALNSVANRNVVRPRCRHLHVFPAAEDNGVAVGAALFGLTQLQGRIATIEWRSDSCGRRYSTAEVKQAIAAEPLCEVICEENTADVCVDLLMDQKIVGWFQGGSEFGPRALGNRSILANPLWKGAKEALNARVKHREPFRPFAPAVLAEEANVWFEIDAPDELTDYMLDVCPFRESVDPEMVPAVRHRDGTGRLQTVHASRQPRFHQLIAAFRERSGVPMLVNTSLNVMGEPIVETPADALWLLMFTGIDALLIENVLVQRSRRIDNVLDCILERTAAGEQALTAGCPKTATWFARRMFAALGVIDGISAARERLSPETVGYRTEAQLALIVGQLVRHGLAKLALPLNPPKSPFLKTGDSGQSPA